MKFKTVSVRLHGAICGPLWQPGFDLCATPLSCDFRWRHPVNLRAVLRAKGGDFQRAQFTADTVIRIERIAVDGPGRYRVHVRELEVSRLAPDLVNLDAYTGDFCHD